MRYTIRSNGFPTITLSKIKTGEIIYAERNSAIASSPVTSTRNISDQKAGKLMRRRLMVTELEGADYTIGSMPTPMSKKWAEFKLGTKQTLDRKRIGERSYVLYEALADDQKVTFRSCFPGTIMIWDARPLEKDETFDMKDSAVVDFVDNTDPNNLEVHFINNDPFDNSNLQKKRPHGKIYTVRGSFLAAEIAVKAKVYHTKDVAVKRFSMTDDSFQEFSGNGNVFLEVHGDLIEIPLYKGEAVDVWPGYLLGFTEGIGLEMKPAGDATLRNEENNDYVIRLTAGDKGGFVYTHSIRAADFWAGMPATK